MGRCNSANPSHPRSGRGFSLVELVVTLAVVGLVAGIAGPRMFRRESFDDRITRDRMAGSLRYAQRLALATGCDVRFQLSGSQWRLDQRATCASGAFTRDVVDPADGSPSYQASAAGNVTITSSSNPVIFDSRGRSVDGSGALVTVDLSAGARTVQVVGETGYVRFP